MNYIIINDIEQMIREVENRPTGFPLQPTILKIILDLYKSGKNEIVAREISKILNDAGTKYPSICGTMKKIVNRGLAKMSGKNTSDLKLIFNMRRILITGGAGFIGSNLCEDFLAKGDHVVCLDNFSTGFRHNIEEFLNNPNFRLIEGDIRNLETCKAAVEGIDYVLHHAALGSVPRSIKDPITTNEVNIGGFLNMLVASRDAGVKRFIYAASSSTYGDSTSLPKVEDIIGKPLSPYAITKYVNELYADVFAKTYGMECIGLRYFNVFGRRQSSEGAYAAVIPLWVKQFMNHESPVINGDGEYSRDFTYIDNVIQVNELAMEAKPGTEAVNQVYNVACGERTTLNQLISYLKKYLSEYDPKIADIDVIHGPNRVGDISHSLALIDKANNLLGYRPKFNMSNGLYYTVKWYING